MFLMVRKFQNKYRIESTRLRNWDYGNNGAYFITICTQNKKHFFGEITNQCMELNKIGLLANNFWEEIPNHFPFIELGNFQIMPNHIHGILIMNKINIIDTLQCNASTNITPNDTLQFNASMNIDCTDTLQCNASTEKNEFLSKISPKSGSISTIIRSYKSIVTKNARLQNIDFEWQSGFHDHIIRSAESYDTIQNYIAENPTKWNEDKFYN